MEVHHTPFPSTSFPHQGRLMSRFPTAIERSKVAAQFFSFFSYFFHTTPWTPASLAGVFLSVRKLLKLGVNSAVPHPQLQRFLNSAVISSPFLPPFFHIKSAPSITPFMSQRVLDGGATSDVISFPQMPLCRADAIKSTFYTRQNAAA